MAGFGGSSGFSRGAANAWANAAGVGFSRPIYDRDGAAFPLKFNSVALSPAAKAGGAGGAVASGVNSAVSLDTGVTIAGRPTIKLSGPGTPFPTLRWAVPVKRAVGRIGLRVRLDSAATVVPLALDVSSDAPAADPPNAAAANRRALSVLNPHLQKGGVWNDYVFDVAAPALAKAPGGTMAAWATSAGAPDTNLIQQLQFSANFSVDPGVANRNIWIDQFYLDGGAVPFVNLTFDSILADNSASDTLKTWYKLLKERELVGTFFADADKFTQANSATFDLLYAAGNDVAQQAGGGARGHYNYLTAYNTNATQAMIDLENDWASGDAALVARGYTSARDCFAWAQAGHNAALDAVLYAKGVRFSRGGDGPPRIVISQDGAPQTLNPGVLVTTPHFQTDGVGNVAADFTAWTTDAILHGTGYCTLTHTGTTGAATSNTETRISEMTAFLDDLAAKQSAGKIRVLTASQYLKMINCPRVLV